jgi:hypothetical protein
MPKLKAGGIRVHLQLRGTKQSLHRQINYADLTFLFSLYSIEIASCLAMTRGGTGSTGQILLLNPHTYHPFSRNNEMII